MFNVLKTNVYGENLLIGELGHFFVICAFVTIILAGFSYFKHFRNPKDDFWLKTGRWAFFIQGLCVVAQFAGLFYIIHNHLYEYKYAYLHSDNSLAWQYLLSCFWEGQEGSFLLWIFWNAVLGSFFIFRKSKLENSVLGIICIIQTILLAFLLGFYIFETKIGLNAFALLKEEMSWPILSRPDYLAYIKDGTGLNTLLQNYWMVIHPPILFLGFSSLILPFALVCSRLLQKKDAVFQSIIPYTNFSIAVLGLGIMMGAAWAYESLSFGGYWAWDPVENASLVPWMILVAALHSNIIYNKNKNGIKTTIFLYGLAYFMVIYSTFLTRSGILGDTSVHAFTDLGMNTQLLMFVILVGGLFIGLFLYGYRSLSEHQTSHNFQVSSREFWVFIFAWLQLFMAGFIIFKTSLPVFNKLFNTHLAPPQDLKFSYNNLLIFLVIFIGIFSGVAQYLRYKQTPKDFFIKAIWKQIVLSFIVAVGIIYVLKIHYDIKGIGFQISIYLGLWAVVFGAVANINLLIKYFKKPATYSGSFIVHAGFCVMLLGILCSSAKQEALIGNYLTNNSDGENITLFENIPIPIGRYEIEYMSDSSSLLEPKKFFNIQFRDSQTHQAIFTLTPHVIKNNKGGEGFSANPDVKHYWFKDIFVYLTSFQDNKENNEEVYQKFELKKGDTAFYSKGFLILSDIKVTPIGNNGEAPSQLINFEFEGQNLSGQRFKITPSLTLNKERSWINLDSNKQHRLWIRYHQILDQVTGKFSFEIKDLNQVKNIITIKVYVFPFINFVWLGLLIMVIGCLILAFKRVKTGLGGGVEVNHNP